MIAVTCFTRNCQSSTAKALYWDAEELEQFITTLQVAVLKAAGFIVEDMQEEHGSSSTFPHFQ